MSALITPAGHLGDFDFNTDYFALFSSHSAAGVPASLAVGGPSCLVYRDEDSTPEDTNSVVVPDIYGAFGGMNLLSIYCSLNNAFFEAGKDYSVVFASGASVGADSVVGQVIATFSIAKRHTLRLSTGNSVLRALNDGTVEADVEVWKGWPVVTPFRLGYPVVDSEQVVRVGTAQSGTANTIKLDAAASGTSDFYNGMMVQIHGGTGTNQAARRIASYVGATKVATVVPNWIVNPDGTSLFVMFQSGGAAEWAAGFAAAQTAHTDLAAAIAAVKAKSDLLSTFPAQGIKATTAFAGFPFVLISSADHFTPITGRTVVAQRSIDGAAFGACANAVTEVSNGIYTINLATTDLAGARTVTLRFTASGADPRLIVLLLTP